MVAKKYRTEPKIYKADKCFRCGKDLEVCIPIILIHPRTKERVQLCTKECYYAVLRSVNIKY